MKLPLPRLLSRWLSQRSTTPPASTYIPPDWLRGQSREEVFTRIHDTNHWGDQESVSGPGSTASYTQAIRTGLPILWDTLGTRVVLDAPCGDFNWFRLIPRKGAIHYIGGDIVRSLAESNQARFGDATTRFIQLDIVADPLPAADFWLCRDCLFHIPNADILAALRNFARSDIAYLCTSIHPGCTHNEDVPAGGFRPLNLQYAPFNLGPPATVIDDWIEGFIPRQLALWRRQDVVTALRTAIP